MDASSAQHWPETKIDFSGEGLQTERRNLRVLGKVYRTTTARAQLGDQTCLLIDVASHNYDPNADKDVPNTVVDINWNVASRDFHEAPILFRGDMFRFRSLANSPVMAMWRNRHRWDASEHIVATREDLMRALADHHFDKPWLIFNQTRLFPATPRIPNSVISDRIELGIMVSDVMETLLADKKVEGDLHSLFGRLKDVGKTHRYLEVQVPRSVFHRSSIHKVAAFINDVFFHAGVVLLRKCERRAGDDEGGYQGRQGDMYHDLKLQVDRLATFSGGLFDTGWKAWLEHQPRQEFRTSKLL